MAAILDAILDFEECQQGISGDFLSVILHIFMDLSWKNQLVTKNVQVKTNIIGLVVKRWFPGVGCSVIRWYII